MKKIYLYVQNPDDIPKTIYYGKVQSVEIDDDDIMRKSEYDINRDGYVDKLKRLSDIQDVEDYKEGKVLVIKNSDPEWSDVETNVDIDEIDGGIIVDDLT